MKDFFKECAQKSAAVLCTLSLTVCFVFSGCSAGKGNNDELSTTTQALFQNEETDVFAEYTQTTATTGYVSTASSSAVTQKTSKTEKTQTKKTKAAQNSGSDKVFDDAQELQNFIDSNVENNGTVSTTATTGSQQNTEEKPVDYRLIKWYIDSNGNITTEGDKGVLGFGYSTSEHCFYATGNAWQRNFGYTRLYDKVSELIVISYDTIRVYFTYDNKDWMIQLWKGQYGLVLEGGEVGVYNRPHSFNVTSYYNCAQDSDRLPISLSLYDKGRLRFSRKAQDSWWMTGFVPGQLGLGVGVGSVFTQFLTETTTITFKNETMRNAFIDGLKNVKTIFNNVDYAVAVSNNIIIRPGERLYSFKEGTGTSATVLNGTYKINGNSVTITWK